MVDFSITLGNKNYSSWSLRGWLPLQHCGVDFSETVIPLRQADSGDRLRAAGPSAKVPVLHVADEDLVIQDSLAIGEYLAERFPQARLWPQDRRARAVARAVTCEMHSSFPALRGQMPMDLRNRWPDQGRQLAAFPDVARDIARVVTIWDECRRRFGGADAAEDQGFLFGHFTLADAAFAPVAGRFATYEVTLTGAAAAYRDCLLAAPVMAPWLAAARDEPWVIGFPENPVLASLPAD